MEKKWIDDNFAAEVEKVQLLLSEKRTALSLLRTGIAIFALPLSVVSVLIATSHFYVTSKVLPLLIPVLTISAILGILGTVMVFLAIIKYRALDRKIMQVKAAHQELKELIT